MNNRKSSYNTREEFFNAPEYADIRKHAKEFTFEELMKIHTEVLNDKILNLVDYRESLQSGNIRNKRINQMEWIKMFEPELREIYEKEHPWVEKLAIVPGGPRYGKKY